MSEETVTGTQTLDCSSEAIELRHVIASSKGIEQFEDILYKRLGLFTKVFSTNVRIFVQEADDKYPNAALFFNLISLK